MKIVTILGARPQFIKAAMLSKAYKSYSFVTEILIHTGQHFDHNMSDVFFADLALPEPQYNLHVNSLDHAAMTGQMMEKLEPILKLQKPDIAVVFGDTNSTLAGALTAKKLNIKIAHIEAGLRSFNTQMPEEVNRIVVDRIADLLFCPSMQAVKNLEREGASHADSQIFTHGDVMKDATLYFRDKALKNSEIVHNLGLSQFVLATLHRQENINNTNNLKEIVEALNQINNTIPVLIPMHPRTQKAIQSAGISTSFHVIEPQGYLNMLSLIQQAELIITDSGGLQKEAYFFNKYCITTRNETEWIELTESNVNFLTGAKSQKIIDTFTQLYKKETAFNKTLYGSGNAAELTAAEIVKYITS